MQKAERKTIENIILIEPMIYGLQDKIDREQESVVSDMTAPASKTVEKLIALDNRRIDLCNLKVLYGFIERGLRDRFELLRACAASGTDCSLFDVAAEQMRLAGYTVARAAREFEYLFKLVKRKRGVKKIAPKSRAETFACYRAL